MPHATQCDDDPLLDLQQVTLRVLKEGGVDNDDAERLADNLRDAVQANWGGQQIYIKKTNSAKLNERDLKIYEQFNGRNQYELAKQYGLTVQYIYSIVKEIGAVERKHRQPELFPGESQD